MTNSSAEPLDAPTGARGSTPSKESESYTHGHHESVLRSHRWRTAENSAGFLLPHLTEQAAVLDVGCGPGTVTVDLARHVPGGSVVGVDASEKVLTAAREHAADTEVSNVEFRRADAYHLPFEDDTFDVVYAHQVLQHLSNPVAALREMRRVAKPGAYVAVRESDYAAMTWYPDSHGLTEWNELYHEVTRAYGFEADAGRRLLSWVQEAGFPAETITPSAGVWSYSTAADRRWWGGLWAERCIESNFAVQAKESGLADDVALEQLAQDWLHWAEEPAGWFAVLHGEVLARA